MKLCRLYCPVVCWMPDKGELQQPFRKRSRNHSEAIENSVECSKSWCRKAWEDLKTWAKSTKQKHEYTYIWRREKIDLEYTMSEQKLDGTVSQRSYEHNCLDRVVNRVNRCRRTKDIRSCHPAKRKRRIWTVQWFPALDPASWLQHLFEQLAGADPSTKKQLGGKRYMDPAPGFCGNDGFLFILSQNNNISRQRLHRKSKRGLVLRGHLINPLFMLKIVNRKLEQLGGGRFFPCAEWGIELSVFGSSWKWQVLEMGNRVCRKAGKVPWKAVPGSEIKPSLGIDPKLANCICLVWSSKWMMLLIDYSM